MKKIIFNRMPQLFVLSKLIVVVGVFIFSNEASGQLKKATLDPWILNQSVKNVNCYYKIVDCSGEKRVFLKFENKNSSKVTITWKESFYVEQFNEKKTLSGGKKQLVLARGEVSQTDCSTSNQRELLTGPPELTPVDPKLLAFEFKEIVVSK